MKKTMKMSMKKTMKNMLSMAAAVLTATIMTACAGSDDSIADTPQLPENQSKTITLTTTVGLGGANGGATTRALTSGGVKTFAEGDRMAVIYKNKSDQTVKAVADITSGAGTKSATFTVTLDDPDCDAPIRYIYPAAMAKETVATDASIDDAGTVDLTNLASQNGTLATLGSNLDLCTYDAPNWSSGELPVGATLANQLAVLAVTVKDAGGAYDITSGITGLTVSDGTNSYTATGCDADGHIYLAIRPTANADITVTATDGLIHYEKTLADKKTYEASNFYNVGWRMMPTKTTPLTMEALTAGTIKVKDPQEGMKYSVNGGDKTTMSGNTTINVGVGDKVQFYGNRAAYYWDGSSDFTTIAGGTAEVKMYGNIMSLVNETGYADATTLTADNTFRRLFDENTKLTDASGLLLPATTLAQYCYASMFEGCSSLTAAPALPAKTLANYCYYSMFNGCTSLTTAPALPATTLAINCYRGMFFGCTKLNAVTCLATDISATGCTTNWLAYAGTQAEGTKTFTKAASTTWTTGADGIPDGWTVQDAQ